MTSVFRTSAFTGFRNERCGPFRYFFQRHNNKRCKHETNSNEFNEFEALIEPKNARPHEKKKSYRRIVVILANTASTRRASNDY